jgi:signal peptidase II
MQRYRFGFAVALLVFILDQLAKWIVTHPLGINQIGDQLVLLPIFNFTYTQNVGISLGQLPASSPLGRWLLVLVTAAIAVGVAVWIGREKNRIDQARFGYVVDFADLHFGTFRPFLVFNVGDAAISIAVVILLLRAFVARKDHREGPEPKETIEHA